MATRIENTTKAALVDPPYRYWLSRAWGGAHTTVLWVMLNPSTADAEVDDPTIRKCIGFTQLWGFESLAVVNLYAYRATDPRDLMQAKLSWYGCMVPDAPDPVGQMNDEIIAEWLNKASVRAGCVVVAWGGHGDQSKLRAEKVLRLIRESGHSPLCLGTTRSGQPRHPSRIAYATPPARYEG